jgi:hypothetical protein
VSGNRCVILAIDPGEVSGWAIHAWPFQTEGLRVPGVSGTAATHAERCSAVTRARSVAELYQMPLVIVAETWTRFGKWGAAQAAGTAAQWGRWQVAIDEAQLAAMPKLGRVKAFSGVVRVQSNVWYSATCGTTRDPREVRLQRAMLRAGVNNPDEACALCIAAWAEWAPKVRKLLPAAFQPRQETTRFA